MGGASLKKGCEGACTGVSGSLMEIQRSRVHTVAFAGRRRAVIEDMAEMCPAAGTEHFGAYHPARGIGMITDIEP